MNYWRVSGGLERGPRDNQFVVDYPDMDQMDLNPVFVYATGVKIVDARIVLRD